MVSQIGLFVSHCFDVKARKWWESNISDHIVSLPSLITLTCSDAWKLSIFGSKSTPGYWKLGQGSDITWSLEKYDEKITQYLFDIISCEDCEILIIYYPECLTWLTYSNRWKPGLFTCKNQPHTTQNWGKFGMKS